MSDEEIKEEVVETPEETVVPEPVEGPLLKGRLPLAANSGSFDKLNHHCFPLPPLLGGSPPPKTPENKLLCENHTTSAPIPAAFLRQLPAQGHDIPL